MALPARNHRISLSDAAALTRRHRETGPRGAEMAGAFHADQVRELLAQKDCVALRIYYGKQADGKGAVILVGMDSNDKELTGGVVLEFSFPCPPFCTDDSPLSR